ncbi:hypothetical protein LSTR_LSTR000018 [Laodelphax striatellus]|uniref:Uncharacterized protein n=1 Tax=Laodelphax striatellus TaxID=195883 RepID=A0A482X6A2_LAOST|nr:hypothetical protein LSTR_LSTR000018 [Laodelphax striatellus]
MQLMLLNSLLMFDLVFIFFLFLVGVSCIVYYLPGSSRAASLDDSLPPPPPPPPVVAAPWPCCPPLGRSGCCLGADCDYYRRSVGGSGTRLICAIAGSRHCHCRPITVATAVPEAFSRQAKYSSNGGKSEAPHWLSIGHLLPPVASFV